MRSARTWCAVVCVSALLGCGGGQRSVDKRSPTSEAKPAPEAACPAGRAMVTRDRQPAREVSVQEAFSGARSGDAVDLCPGRAVTDRTYVLNGVQDVTITGSKTSLVASGDFPVVSLEDCQRVVLQGVHVVHEVGEWCAHGCVEITRSSEVTVRDSELDGSGYFGVIVTNTRDTLIEGNLFHNCTQGFSAWSSTGVTLKGNTFRDNREVDVYPDKASAQFVNDVAQDNTFGPKASSATTPDRARPETRSK